jgi:hypothetical protein
MAIDDEAGLGYHQIFVINWISCALESSAGFYCQLYDWWKCDQYLPFTKAIIINTQPRMALE